MRLWLLVLFCMAQYSLAALTPEEQALALASQVISDPSSLVSSPDACDSTVPFRTFKEFINHVCANADNLDPSELRRRGGDGIVRGSSGGTHGLSDFLRVFAIFQRSQAIDLAAGLVQASFPAKGVACPFDMNARLTSSADLGDVSFIGVRHWYNLTPEERETSRAQLRAGVDANGSKAVLLEGFEVGIPMDCRQTLRTAFTPDAQLPAETAWLVKEGFWEGWALVPADNQKIDLVDVSAFYGGDMQRVRSACADFVFVDVLHSYFSNLRSDVPDPLRRSTAESYSELCPPYSVEAFKARYFELNGRQLPTDAAAVYEDFTPSAHSPVVRGSNRLVDIQDDLRNRSILAAVSTAQKAFGPVTAVFGASHWDVVGPELVGKYGPPVPSQSCR
jgi:hypothetical protein